MGGDKHRLWCNVIDRRLTILLPTSLERAYNCRTFCLTLSIHKQGVVVLQKRVFGLRKSSGACATKTDTLIISETWEFDVLTPYPELDTLPLDTFAFARDISAASIPQTALF